MNVEGKDEPKKANDHMLENIHRILIAGARYIQPAGQIKQRVVKGIGRQ
jgi:hypothetical protein